MSTFDVQSLFAAVPSDQREEQFLTLLQSDHFRLVRIVSTGQTTPEGEWYDQDENEWVAVLHGRAEVRFADGNVTKTLNPGEYLHISAHVRHRVEKTDPEQPTVWLALHYS
ncbi:MAG: cupin domain-containing protein [Alphaproteobacteria bacterium]|nr:cupin domain-containing protein [Alphaproteobacteria bacterium]